MLRINERPIDEGIVLELEGDLRTPYGPPAFFEAVARCTSEGYQLVVADLSSVRNVDAAGLGSLLRARNLLAAVGRELQLINPNRFVRELLRLTRLDTIIKVLPAMPDQQPSFCTDRGTLARTT